MGRLEALTRSAVWSVPGTVVAAGKSLEPVLQLLKRWGEEHAMDLIAERQRASTLEQARK